MRRVALATMTPRCVFGARSTLTACSGGTTTHTATPASCVTFNQMYLCATRSAKKTSAMTKTSQRHPLDELKQKFGQKSWKTFEEKMPEWEQDLRLAGFSDINPTLVACGISPLKTPALANALVEYFQQSDGGGTEVKGLFQAIESAQLAKHGNVEKLTLAGFDWLTHPGGDFMRTVYVRGAYKRLWDVVKKAHAVPVTALKKSHAHALIIGNPGIGKSWSLNYLLHLALKEKLTSVVILRTVEAWYCFHDGKCYEHQNFPGKDWVHSRLKPGERGLLLHDIGKARNAVSVKFMPAAYGRLCIVLASSPRDENYVDLEQNYKAVKFYCPMLTRGEFQSIYPQHMAEFDKYGGCLRDVGDASREDKLVEKVKSFDFGSISVNVISERHTHSILQVVPNAHDSKKCHLSFVSKYVEKLFFTTRWEALKKKVLKDLHDTLHNEAQRQLYGIPFENYVQEYAHKLDFTRLQNIDGSAATPSIVPPNFIPPKKDFHLVAKDDNELHRMVKESLSKNGRWIQPKIPNFPVLDAFFVVGKKVYGVQVTISNTHQPTTSTLKELLDHGVSFGAHTPKGKVHIDGVIFVIDEYRNPLMKEAQLVPRKQKDGRVVRNRIGDAWKSNNPQYRLLVSCKEWVK